MTSSGGRLGARGRGGLIAIAITVCVLFLAGAAEARHRSRHAPVPSCRWTPSSLISTTFGVPVRGLAPIWRTTFAPELTCGYVERQPNLQFGNVPIVAVQYREFQRFKPPVGSVPVGGLGSCVEHSSCPAPGQPAWLKTLMVTRLAVPYSLPYTGEVLLGVEDGLNAIIVEVVNPYGPLPVANAVARAEGLARDLLPKFRWRGGR